MPWGKHSAQPTPPPHRPGDASNLCRGGLEAALASASASCKATQASNAGERASCWQLGVAGESNAWQFLAFGARRSFAPLPPRVIR